MTTKRRDPEATRNSIIEAACEVFLKKGFGETSMNEIAQHAGVTKSLIHHHFGSKEDLWQAVKGHTFGAYFAIQKKMLEESPATIDLLKDSVRLYFRKFIDNPDFNRLVCWNHLENTRFTMPEATQVMQLGAEKIFELQQKGELRDDIPAVHLLITFLSMIEHWAFWREELQKKGLACALPNPTPEQDADEAYLETLVKIFFSGVHPNAKGLG
jgi:TetR/AcrR family transcriptional regulator